MRACSKVCVLLAVFLFLGTRSQAREFIVMVYNVENLMDIDDVNAYASYAALTANPYPYTPLKLLTKLQNLAFIFKQVNDGRGPEIALLNEVETDKTPLTTHVDYAEWLEKYKETTYKAMLTQKNIPDEIKKLPATFWILKALADEGMKGYALTHAAPPPQEEKLQAVHNVTLSRFPIKDRLSFLIPRGREILEVHHNIDGHTLITFNNHWKSGAGSYEFELARVDSARVLRHRVNEILYDDPHADVIIAGDFNAHYNQSVYLQTVSGRKENQGKPPRASINFVLQAQGKEEETAQKGRPVFYNLWAELPHEQRKSDTFQGNWGTLIQMMVTRGLYDFKGIQYVDNSFKNLIIDGVNTIRGGRPRGWTFYGKHGGGYSDHFPILARYRVVQDNDPNRVLELENPSSEDLSQSPILKVKLPEPDLEKAEDASVLIGAKDEKIVASMGEIFRVKGRVIFKNPLLILVNGCAFSVHGEERKTRLWLRGLPLDSEVEFYGELTDYEDHLQFTILKDIHVLRPPVSPSEIHVDEELGDE